jgi:hypothetical protein
MNYRFALGATLVGALLVGSTLAAESLKSGPQVGKGLTPFNPLHCNGENEGKKLCLV